MGKSVFAYKMEWLKKELESERINKRNTILSEKNPDVNFYQFCKLNNIRLLPIEKIRNNITWRNLDVSQVFDRTDPIYQDYLQAKKHQEEIINKKLELVDKEIGSILHDAIFVKEFDFDGAVKKFKRAKF